MKNTILLVSEHDRNTVLAALRYFQQCGMGEAENLSPEILSIATDDGQFPVMNADEIDALCMNLNSTGCNVSAEDLLAEVKALDVPFSACIAAYAAPDDNQFVKAAQALSSDDIQVDDKVVLSESENGAFALCWRWISNAAAGFKPYSEILEDVHNVASETLAQGIDSAAPALDQVFCDWLEDLITNYADELDGIEEEVVMNVPGQIAWLDQKGDMHHFMPSSALFRLIQIAKQGGLSNDTANHADQFATRFGNKLDCILTVVQTD